MSRKNKYLDELVLIFEASLDLLHDINDSPLGSYKVAYGCKMTAGDFDTGDATEWERSLEIEYKTSTDEEFKHTIRYQVKASEAKDEYKHLGSAVLRLLECVNTNCVGARFDREEGILKMLEVYSWFHKSYNYVIHNNKKHLAEDLMFEKAMSTLQ